VYGILISVTALYRKSLNKGVLLYIHINFCISLSLALLVFIAGIETAVDVYVSVYIPTQIIFTYINYYAYVQVLCKLVAVSLHYLFLCAFCWMLAEGIMLYLLVVKVFGKHASRWYYLLPIGWGRLSDDVQYTIDYTGLLYS